MPKAKAAPKTVVGRIAESGREIHTRIVKGRKHSLNFVIDRYLPKKLKHPEKFLP